MEIKGYREIGVYGRKVFDETHQKHLKAMGTSEKKKYGRDQVKSIKANNKESCLEIRFKNGELFKYNQKREWY